MWLPSALAVASLYATPRRRWPWLLASLFVAQLLTFLWLAIPLVSAVGFAVANQVEAVICATLGIRVLGGRRNSPRTFAHVAGLFAAGLLGCAAGAVVGLP